MRKGMLLLGFVGAAVLGALPFCRWMAGGGPPELQASAPAAGEDRRPHVEITPAVRKTVYRKLELTGDLVADHQAALMARVQGYVQTVVVDRGATVKAGDVLARLSVPELEGRLAREKAEFSLCAPSLARDQATLAWRESSYRRLEELRTKSPNLVNAEMLDEARGRYAVAKAEVEVTRAKEFVLRAEVCETESLIGLATITAPFAGVITERWVDPGDLAQPGQTKLFHLMKTDPVRVRIAVPEIDVPSVRDGASVKITIRELVGKNREAKVSRRFWALNRSTKTMWAEIDVPNPDGAVRPGMFARVTLDLEAHPDVLVLPAAALVAEKKKMFVFVVKDGKAKKTPITVGVDDGLEFEVRQGLDPADDVIVSGKNLVSDGAEVRTTRKDGK